MKVIDSTNLGYLWGKIKAAFFSKDDSVTIGIDSTPTQNSDNLVKSGGVYTAVSAKYTKPLSGIPASDLASGVIPSVPVQDVTVGGTSVVSNGVAAVPEIPDTVQASTLDIDSTPTANSNNLVTSGGTYASIHPAVGSSQPSGGMLPNVLYNLGTLSGDTTFVFAAAPDANIVNEWMFQFTTPSTAPTITWPAAITGWSGGNAPTIKASKTYQVSVVNGLGVIAEF